MAKKYKIHNLVSNLNDLAQFKDANLIQPWGVLFFDDHLWVSDHGSNLITRYDIDGKPEPEHIIFLPKIPTGQLASPTGLVVNQTQGFVVVKNTTQSTAQKTASLFLIASKGGVIYGFNPILDPKNAFIAYNGGILTPSVYTGLALVGEKLAYLYVADFYNQKVVVFNFSFLVQSNFPFADLETNNPIPSNYSPFNIVHIGHQFLVSYAQQSTNKQDPVHGQGHGYVSVFNLNGTFVKRLISQGQLNSPWGMAVAPDDFGSFSNKLLIANSGDGKINVYEFNGKYLGTLQEKDEKTIILSGLLGLITHNKSIFTTSNPNNATNGLITNIRK